MSKYELTRILHGESCSDDWDDMRKKMGLANMPYLEYLELRKPKRV